MNIELDLDDSLIEKAKAFLPPQSSLQYVIEHCLKEWIALRLAQIEHRANRVIKTENN